MCESSAPIEELKNLKFAVAALATMVGELGSYSRSNANFAADGIKARIDWIVANLQRDGEGKKNFGLSAEYPKEKG